ncbi:MAG: hypothetical protein NZ571_16055, partial [Anaerolineae bacterium]|nr:hypothetical protein [Anaerolineae bacterium]
LIGILSFYTQVAPLSDYKYRFLVGATWVVYIASSVTAGLCMLKVFEYIAGSIDSGAKLAERTVGIFFIFLFTSFTVLAFSSPNLDKNFSSISISIQRHPYALVSSPWSAKLRNPNAITMVYTEAGLMPYTLQTRYVDVQGLTEPFIARLFTMPDGDEKTKLFTQHVLSNHPDVVLQYWWYAWTDGMLAGIRAPVDVHSPFRKQIPAAIYKAYRDYGMIYGCTVRGFHVLLWRNSPYGVENLRQVFCSHPDALYFADGLIVMSEGQSVYFPPIAEVAGRKP